MKPVLEIPTVTARGIPEIEQQPGLNESIRQRAYELYDQRGHIDGHELEDWLQAEAEAKEKAVAA